jgi:hypothetical protein
MLLLAWHLDQLGRAGGGRFTQKEIQAQLALSKAATKIHDPKADKPSSEPSYDAAFDALKRGDFGDLGGGKDKDGPDYHPYYRTAARYVAAGAEYVASLPQPVQDQLRRDLRTQRRVHRIFMAQRALKQKLGRDLTDEEIRSTLAPARRKSVVKSVVKRAAKPGVSRGTTGNRRRALPPDVV